MRFIKPAPAKAAVFSFAVVADTHVNEHESECSSPYQTNLHANARARHVFEQIRQIQDELAFVVHLGDIVHPVPGLDSYVPAVENFKALTAGLRIPLHVVPGNHDVGDKRVDWMPADHVCAEYLQIYRRHFGPDWFSFERDGCAFVMLNSLLLNAGLPQEREQADWLDDELARLSGKRVFCFMHYPPYLHDPDEPGNYDNIDQPGRAWLLQRLAGSGVEAVFCGHVHNYWLDTIGQAMYYMLPSTAFMRHDFSAFYRVAPQIEFGRGDPGRFGYFIVDVHADGHVAYSVRSGARRQSPVATAPAGAGALVLAHPMTSAFAGAGVELRHPWAQSEQITATGGVQEFGRKIARNDYPLQALLEMGVRLVTVPEIDYRQPATAQRLRLLRRLGVSAIVSKLGAPDAGWRGMQDDGVVAVVCNRAMSALVATPERDQAFKRANAVALYFSPIRDGHMDARTDGATFTHAVKAGFRVAELPAQRERVAARVQEEALDGVVVRAEFGDDLAATAAGCAAFATETGAQVLVSIKTTGPSVARLNSDDPRLAWLAAQALLLSRLYGPAVRFVFDTFADVDRGYFPRHAFIDGHFDARPAGVAWRQLTAALSASDGPWQLEGQGPGWLALKAGQQPLWLLERDSVVLPAGAGAPSGTRVALGLESLQCAEDGPAPPDAAKLPLLIVGAG